MGEHRPFECFIHRHLAGYDFDDFVLAQAGKDLGETSKQVDTNVITGNRTRASAITSDIINKNCGGERQ